MAGQDSVRQAVRRLDAAVRSFAARHGWGPGDYRAYVQVNETWGYIHLLLAAKAFPGKTPEEQWLAVLDHLDAELKDDRLLFDALHLTLRTFDQIAEGGLYAVGEQFVPIGELVAPAPAA